MLCWPFEHIHQRIAHGSRPLRSLSVLIYSFLYGKSIVGNQHLAYFLVQVKEKARDHKSFSSTSSPKADLAKELHVVSSSKSFLTTSPILEDVEYLSEPGSRKGY